MYESYGKDSRLNPQALLDSGAEGLLITELMRIRHAHVSCAFPNETALGVELDECGVEYAAVSGSPVTHFAWSWLVRSAWLNPSPPCPRIYPLLVWFR
jgi:hypothetical protein